MLAPRLAILAIVGSLFAACAKAPDTPSPEARACAELVAFYRGVPRPLELKSHASEPGRVRIDYRSKDREGVALCHVRGREDGGFEITAAVVDENRLKDEQIAAFEARR